MRIALLILLAAVVAGCGATASLITPARPVSARASAAGRHAVVLTRRGALGTFLVDGRGRTLYRFLKDTGRQSRCAGTCAQFWPPLTTREKPEAAGGAKRSLLSTIRRRDGSRQVLYAGHPLYRYAPDSSPGQTLGQGLVAFGARWYVVAPSGRTITSPAPASTATPSPDPGGYGYGY